MNRRVFLRAATIAAAGVIAPKVARARSSPRLRVTRHRIPWETERPIRIIQLTDVHVGWTTPKRVLADTILVAKKLKPDLVALTGDYVNASLKHAGALSDFISDLPKPIFATLGNHDHWSGAQGVSEALARGGARVLVNESATFDGRGRKLRIVGIDDGRTEHDDIDKAFQGVPKKEPALVLTHYPNTADRIMDRGTGLAIAGHTHGGQVAIPGVTKLVSRLAGQRYLAGWYEVGDGSLYVSAGIGASLDGLRGGRTAMPEIAVYDLVPAVRAGVRADVRADVRGRRSWTAAFDGSSLVRLESTTLASADVLRAPFSDDL
jgi:predicted MPP superfamily phosphohydrolase